LISSNTFLRTGGTAAFIDYQDQGLYNNYNTLTSKTYLIDNNTGIINSEAELEGQFNSSQTTIGAGVLSEIEFNDNSEMLAMTNTRRWGVQMNLTGVEGGEFSIGNRILEVGVATPHSALIIHADAAVPSGPSFPKTQTIYLCDFSGSFSAGVTQYNSTGVTVLNGSGTLFPRYRFCGNAPRQLTLTSTWNVTAGNNSTVKLYPGDNSGLPADSADTSCESRTVTSASGVGSSMSLVCSRKYNPGDILNFYVISSAGSPVINRAVICVH